MTKKEQVLAVLNGERPDEMPCGFWLHFPAGNEYGQAAVDTHLKFFQESGTSLCKIMNENTVPKQTEINCAADLNKMKPISHDDPIITREVELVKNICSEMNGEAVMLITVHGIIASAFHALVGVEKNFEENRAILVEYLRENPEGMKHVFGILADYLTILSKECLAAGCDGVYYAALGGEDFLLTDEEFETFVKPYELQILEAAKDAPCNVLHMCKDHLNLNRYKAYDVPVYNWGVFSDNPSLIEGRKIFGEDKVYLGGLDDRDGVLVDGTDEEIIAAVHEIMDTFGDKRWILGADCTLPTDVDLHRLHVAEKAASEYRK